MPWQRVKPPHRALFLALTLLLTLAGTLTIPLVHASTYVGYGSANQGASTCGANCSSVLHSTTGLGEIVSAPFAGSIVSAGFFTGTSAPNQIVIMTSSASSLSVSSFSCGSAGTCARDTGGDTFTVQDVESLGTPTNQAFNTVLLANPVSVTSGQFVAVILMQTSPSGAMLMAVGASGTTTVYDTCVNFGTSQPITGNGYATASVAACDSPGGSFPLTSIVGGGFNAAGSVGTTVGIVSCYGNCGSPPVKLTNTNSTHTTNFNQSITLLYEFQSNVNGFLLNVTTSAAKTDPTGTRGVTLSLYAITGACPSGQTPFSPACPALLQVYNQQPVVKGKISMVMGKGAIPVTNGEWFGLGLTCTFAPCDFNDTNTAVPLYQVSGGPIPSPSITQTFSLGNSNMGLWAWISGNVVTGAPPTAVNFGTCGAGIDCILTNVVNFSCTIVTAACQTGASIFWVIILTIVTISLLLFAFGEVMPTVQIGRVFGANMAVLVFIGWLAVFGSFNLVAPWFLILTFLTVAWLFVGRARGTGPI